LARVEKQASQSALKGRGMGRWAGPERKEEGYSPPDVVRNKAARNHARLCVDAPRSSGDIEKRTDSPYGGLAVGVGWGSPGLMIIGGLHVLFLLGHTGVGAGERCLLPANAVDTRLNRRCSGGVITGALLTGSARVGAGTALFCVLIGGSARRSSGLLIAAKAGQGMIAGGLPLTSVSGGL